MPCFRTAAVALLALSLDASAATDCANASNTRAIEECAAREQKAVEAKLNTVYQDVMRRLAGRDDAAVRRKLQSAQRAWIAFRKADCDAVYEKWSGGTIRGTMFVGCMQRRAEQRIKELEDFGAGG
ncbi:lysozyme inhibitor LprI family protein [uncultured Massilia sp.]|uniref:lysozyme inhibitor LprI family protein n=1 Tax=uncultured Massilia sp. TaxID=169973 RepID=UPI0025E8A405|nr:lysozyme inhibitor LprI family protein [uncultured Massilia sp.]